MKPLLVFLFLVFVTGCSANKSLAHRLKEADRVIVTNSFDAVGLTFTGPELRKLVQTIALGKKAEPALECAVEFDLQFFKGNECLAKVPACAYAFGVDRTSYIDTTGDLKALDEKFHQANRPQFSP